MNSSQILQIFEEISKIPRPSKSEDQIAHWILEWAHRHQFNASKDQAGNVLIQVPPSPGFEHKPIVALQGHMDMVCEKLPHASIDPAKDGVELYRDGDWLRAKHTTLGADNGIAIAMILAALKDPEFLHPPLEILFTVDEETGMGGAMNLSPKALKASYFINLDSEDEGVLTIGCAGGKGMDLTLPIYREKPLSSGRYFKLSVSQLVGGHSGVDIHLQRASANVLMARTLWALKPLRLIDIHGGSAHNAIARDAWATVWIPNHKVQHALDLVQSCQNTFLKEFESTDPNLKIALQVLDEKCDVEPMTFESSDQVIHLLITLPHGVHKFSAYLKGLVQTSNNLATVHSTREAVTIHCSQRSSMESELNAICNRIEAMASLAGASVTFGEGYPAWQPDWKATLLKHCQEVYEKKFQKSPIIEVIHAGLECGVISQKYPKMQMISMGPTIKYPHSPDEKLYIPSIALVYDYLKEILKTLD